MFIRPKSSPKANAASPIPPSCSANPIASVPPSGRAPLPSAPTSPPRSSPPSAARSRPPRTRSPQLAAAAAGTLRVRQAASFGALWTVAQVAEQLGIKQALGVTRAAELSYWQVLARVRRPGASLLALVRLAASGAAAGWLGWCRAFTEDDLYANGTWLEGRHAIIERRLWQARPAALKDQLFRYDVTSSYLEGEENALANWGYNRDRTEGKPPVVVGLLTDSQGEPLAIRVYPGNPAIPRPVARRCGSCRRRSAARASPWWATGA